MSELLNLVLQIDAILPQMNDFLNQFHTIILENNINIVTDTESNMFMDIPSNVSEEKTKYLKKKLEILDRLIYTRGDQLEELFEKGSNMESVLRKENPQFKSVILDKLTEYNKLKSSYKH